MPLRPTLLLLATLAACGGSGDAKAADDSAAAVADTSSSAVVAAPPSQAPEPTDVALTAADIDRWAKGMEGERQALAKAEEQLKAAKSQTDTLSAMGATMETATRAAGAAAAGISEDRYNRIRNELGELAAAMAPSEMEASKSMPPEMLAQMKQSREEGLARLVAQTPPDVVEAMRPRAETLARERLQLAFERLRIASGKPKG
jgi:hypothetical protein